MKALDLDLSSLYGRLARRDPELDGVLYVGVRSTGIYCRPVCRARLPLERNMTLFPSAAAAEAAGFRPCLRCRPESVPFSPAWRGTRSSVDRALGLIEDGALDRGSVEELASLLGIGARHLSRLFARHLGATPTQVARTSRLQRARRLLQEPGVPIQEVAERAGFSSARRMRAAFLCVYGRSPSELRGRQARSGGGHGGDRDGVPVRGEGGAG
ncbi:MAG: Ada metal-binding domain-containing protein [Myxococcota bacterium]|nr:Ada metal-binding domain-containing protein [Myxococcota bacterium]